MRAQSSIGSSSHRGFTLVEILVVVVIIGILVSVVGIAVGVLGRDREVQDQTERLWAVLSQAKEESELQGRNVGVIVDQSGYEFVQFDARKWTWKPIVDDDLFAARQLPPGLRITLWLDGREVVLKPHSERASARHDDDTKPEGEAPGPDFSKKLEDADMAPHIMLLASGDVNSFDLRIEREGVDYRWHVHSNPDNTIEMGEVDATS
jgi:general secretion pathway protein H